jgi:tRNA(Ile)-lysidine synthase
MSLGETFLDKVRSTVSRYEMIPKESAVVVGVSGGADSTALLHSLWSLKDELRITLIAGHLNHGIRGKEADEDAVFVEELTSRLGVALVKLKVDVPQLRKQMRMGLEEAARKVRYDFLEGLASDARAARIAVAHTSDDQVETVLLNIIRGTGPDGLAGMPAVRDKIIRPLIDISRKEVETYLNENGLSWRTDTSNLDAEYTRNRVRLQLIPFIEEQFNPRIKDAILSLSQLSREESEVVKNDASNAYASSVVRECPQIVTFNARSLGSLSYALQRRCLRRAIETVKGDLLDVKYEQVERIIEKLRSGEEFTLTLPSGIVYAQLVQNELQIFKREIEPQPIIVSQKLQVPGRTIIPEFGVEIETRYVPNNLRPKLRSQVILDAEKLNGPLIVRNWMPGDRIIPFGMTGHKKLQDLFVDMKIPRQERIRIPVITDSEKIVWVAGLTVSELVRVTEDTKEAIWMECKNTPVEVKSVRD